jgi:hypothetical protein
MMKWLSILISFFFGRMNAAPHISIKETAMSIFAEITYQSRRAVVLSLAAMGTIIFICGGFFISLIDATGQFDRDGAVRMSATLVAGIALLVVAAVVAIWIFASAWPGVRQHAQTHKHQDTASRSEAPSSLEQALALLVMDFVRERELRREQTAKEPPHSEHHRHDREFEREESSAFRH